MIERQFSGDFRLDASELTIFLRVVLANSFDRQDRDRKIGDEDR